jgi:diguanylate cyclase (GGDEF)-like protein
LPNRKLFLKRHEDCIDSEIRDCHALVLLIDINNLKKINDTLGHSAGDQALQIIAKRLDSFFETVTNTARWGGDEFIVVVKDYGTTERAYSIARHLLDIVGAPLQLDTQEVFLSASIGIATYPDDATSASELIRHAGLALHLAKDTGRNEFLFYKESMSEKLDEDLRIETALHSALEQNELRLAYQPIVRSEDRIPVGVEALLRWHSPSFGEVPPSRFIPLLERSGQIVPIGRWVLQTACSDIRRIQHRNATPLRLAVNISARQLLHPSFVGDVKTILNASGFAAELLELEITESVLIENAPVAAQVLGELRAIGVHISADDFGTGYSSLNYLWKFPFNTLKIDKSFVSAMHGEPQARMIVGSILTLAKQFGLNVVAEGIETEAQYAALKDLNCPLIQGYLTGRPEPISALEIRWAAPCSFQTIGQL